MTPASIQALADSQKQKMDDISEGAKKMSLSDLNDQMAALIETSKPMHEARVKTAMTMMILAKEIRLRVLKQHFPGIKIEEVTELCELVPSDRVLGDTEQWAERLKASNITPKRLLVDKTKMVIRLLE